MLGWTIVDIGMCTKAANDGWTIPLCKELICYPFPLSHNPTISVQLITTTTNELPVSFQNVNADQCWKGVSAQSWNEIPALDEIQTFTTFFLRGLATRSQPLEGVVCGVMELNNTLCKGWSVGSWNEITPSGRVFWWGHWKEYQTLGLKMIC